MSFSCTNGTRGRLRASGRTFQIVATTPDTSKIRFDDDGSEITLDDKELRAVAEERGDEG